jgi:hypothetical protein
MRSLRWLACLALAALVTAGMSGQAQAAGTGWGMIRSSLGSAYGAYLDEGQMFARTTSHFKDNRPGGSPVYVRTRYQFYLQNCSSAGCDPGYSQYATRTTVRSARAYWVYSYTHLGLESEADRSRGVINVCQDERFSYDPCSSATAYPSFAY